MMNFWVRKWVVLRAIYRQNWTLPSHPYRPPSLGTLSYDAQSMMVSNLQGHKDCYFLPTNLLSFTKPSLMLTNHSPATLSHSVSRMETKCL